VTWPTHVTAPTADPEQFVEAPQHGSRAATLQHSELLSERKILQGKTPTAMKHASERSEPEKKQIEHDPELYQIHGRTLQLVTDSTVGQSFGEAQPGFGGEGGEIFNSTRSRSS